MNQKNIIALLAVIIIVSTGVATYFIIIKNNVPPSQNNQNQRATTKTNENDIPQSDNLTRIEELGIEVEFFDGYAVFKSDSKTIISFGPFGNVLGSVSSDKKRHIYRLLAVEKRSPDEIIAHVNRVSRELITIEPKIKNINNLIVVKWAEGGCCENRTMVVIGPKKNYLLSSLGCHKDQQFDFDYFEKTIKTIRFLP